MIACMTQKPHTMYDDFIYKGRWWMPVAKGEPTRVNGVLSVKAGAKIRLDVDGEIGPKPKFGGVVNQAQGVIHGTIDDGTSVTLLDVLWADGHYGSAGHTRIAYIAGLCLFGAMFDGHDDVVFNEIEIQLTHLEHWAALVHPFTVEKQWNGEEQIGLTITYKYPAIIPIDLPDPKATIYFNSDVNQQESLNVSAALTHFNTIVVRPHDPTPLEKAFVLLSDLQKFFSLITGERVFVLRFGGTVTTTRLNAATGETIGEGDTQCDVFFSQVEQQVVDTMTGRMIFPLSVLRDDFQRTLLNWFASMTQLRPVYDVFFGMYRTSRMYLQSRFLHLSQAVESFHRRTIGGFYLPDDQFQPIRSQMVAAIPATVDDSLRAKLKSQIRFANEPSLHKRMTAIMNGLSAATLSVICENSGMFVSAIVDTRNYLTHLDESSVENELEGFQLALACQKLELLQTVLLLKHIGLAEAEVVDRIKQCRQFNVIPLVLEQKKTNALPSTIV